MVECVLNGIHRTSISFPISLLCVDENVSFFVSRSRFPVFPITLWHWPLLHLRFCRLRQMPGRVRIGYVDFVLGNCVRFCCGIGEYITHTVRIAQGAMVA